MSIKTVYRLLGVLGVVAPLMTGTGAAQTTSGAGVPLWGHTRTLALPSSVDKFYSDINKIAVKTTGALTSGSHDTGGAKAREGKSLDNLTPGTRVVVHYAVEGIDASASDITRAGPDGVPINEGVVTSVDRSRNLISIALTHGGNQALRLASHAPQSPDGHVHSRVVVYTADAAGHPVPHYFKPIH